MTGYHFSFARLPLTLSSLFCLGLVGCQPMPVANQPVDLSNPSAVVPAPVIPVTTDDGTRVSALEARIRMLESQMQAAQPTLKKVEAMEGHFKTLSLQLDRIATTYDIPAEARSTQKIAGLPKLMEAKPLNAMDAKPIAKPVMKATPKKNVVEKVNNPAPVTLPASVSSGALAVTGVRIGEQPKSVTRIVLDTTKPAAIHYDLDNNEGLLVIDVKGAEWSSPPSRVVGKSPMVASFRSDADSKGARLVIDLKQKARVISTARLSPSGQSGNRVYVDIAPVR